MNFLRLLFPTRDSASVAKERLRIILAHERASEHAPEFLPALQNDLLQVVRRYLDIRDDMISIVIGKEGEYSTLKIDVEFDGARTVAAKPDAGATAPPEAARRPDRARPGRRDANRARLLDLIRQHPEGLARKDIFDRMGLRGDRSATMSASFALTALTRAKQVVRQDGRYRAG